jgi:hypothetical protein
MVLSQMPPLLLSAILVTLAIPATADTSLHVALAPASLQDSDAMASSLYKQGLSSLLEVQLLHVEEAQEMWASLRDDAISLGDRAKLRRTACGQSEQRVHGGPSVWPQVREGTSLTSMESMNAYKIHPPQADPSVAPSVMTSPPRRLQEGVSSDGIALIATAALAVLSFIVQGRVAASEAKDRANLDREHATRQKKQARAGKLMERVQLQMSEFIVSMGAANVHSMRTLRTCGIRDTTQRLTRAASRLHVHAGAHTEQQYGVRLCGYGAWTRGRDPTHRHVAA